MSTEKNREIVRRLVELLNARDVAAAYADFSTDFVDHGLERGPGMPNGIEGSKQFITMLFCAFPDIRVTMEDIVTEGDRVVTRSTAHGIHSGVFLGAPPTGKQVRFSFMEIFRFRDGKIVEHWTEGDNLGVMQQLGVIPPQRRW